MSALENQNLEETWEPDGDGRDGTGRFTSGHRLSRGNRGNQHRRKLLDSITEADIETAVKTLREIMADAKAKGNDRIQACREILDRVAGKPAMSDLSDRVEAIESALERIAQHLEAVPA
ncbi:MAG: hypothetical protein ABSB33_05200 [Tepidisphaeraceae bacterium]|jgi:hypothetical protein